MDEEYGLEEVEQDGYTEQYEDEEPYEDEYGEVADGEYPEDYEGGYQYDDEYSDYEDDDYYEDEEYEDDDEEVEIPSLDLSGIEAAREKLEMLDQYPDEPMQQPVQQESQYEYDEDADVWVDKDTGEVYNDKPYEPDATFEEKFSGLAWAKQEAENAYIQEKVKLTQDVENAAVEYFYTRLGDLADELNPAQVEVLKHDVCSPIMQDFVELMAHDEVDEDTFGYVIEALDDAIDARVSLYDLHGQAQDYINEQHEDYYPLESQQPTYVQGYNDTTTWYGLTKKQEKEELERIYQELTGGDQGL